MPTARYAAIAIAMVLMVAPIPGWAQSNSKEIMARPRAELIEILNNPSASAFEKAKSCQRLAVVGTSDAVPALAALLADKNLNVYARCGLEGIADPAADEALRQAATKLGGRQLVGVINSIGQRKDAKAVGLLKGFLLLSSDPAVVSAAAGALGRIGTTEAAAVLKEAVGRGSPVDNCIADGCLNCAEELATAGNKAGAIALYEAVVKANLPKHLKVAALSGQFRLQQAEAKDLLLAQIHSPDEAFFNVGLAVAREMPGANVTLALAGEVEKLPPQRQALLLLAIGDRKDPAPQSLFLAAAKSPSAVVREAAIRALFRRGDASATFLLDAALGDGRIAQIALDGLRNLPGRKIDAAVTARLAGADTKAKIVLFDLIGARQIVRAAPAVREAISEADESVRLAALAALAQLVGLEDLDLLINKALAAGNPTETAAAQDALRTAALRMADRDGCAAKLTERLKGASAANQILLLDLLGKVAGPKALDAVAGCAKSNDPVLKDAATRVLGEWPNAEAAPVLLEIAKNDPETKYQIRTLRGYIRIARQLEIPWWTASNASEVKLTMFRTAMEVAKRDREKRLALDILTRLPPTPAMLDLATSYLSQPALKDAAADATVKIATPLIDHEPIAVAAAMQKIVDAGVGGEGSIRAQQILDQVRAGLK